MESPGSIAELGAFAASEALRPKTLAVLNSRHPTARTFISDGPVRRIKRFDEKLVRFYEWNLANPSDKRSREAFQDMSEELVQFIRTRSATTPKETKLDDSHGKRMLLIADLVDIIGITTETEIAECLSTLGYSPTRRDLQRYFTLLSHLELVKKKPYSDQTYYLGNGSKALVRFDYQPGAKVRDRARIKSLIRASLTIAEPRRMRVYERELRGSR